MDNLVTDALLGFILPPLLAVIVQTHWSDDMKRNVSWVACAVATVALAYYRGHLQFDADNLQNLAASFATLLTVSSQTYDKFYHPTGIAKVIGKATDITTPASAKDAEIARLRAQLEQLEKKGGDSDSVPYGENHK